LKVKLWGTRAQVPTPHPNTQIHGGNTVCLEVQVEGTHTLILDAGMGLHWLGNDLLKGDFGRGQGRAHILLTHVHWDHIQGIPFFIPMLIPGNHVTIYGPDTALPSQLRTQMDTFFCPVPNFFLEGIGADVVVEDVEASDFSIGTAKIKTALINHQAGITCLGFRIEANGRSIAYLPDVEYLQEAHRQQVIDLIAGVDLLFHDAMLTSEEYPKHRGRGHCSIDDGIDIAVRAKVGRLVLFSHHPDRSDTEIDTILAACSGNGVAVDAGREGTEYAL
jgi:phosphoribosyl 1,2-cyclic phosphodiesterase